MISQQAAATLCYPCAHSAYLSRRPVAFRIPAVSPTVQVMKRMRPGRSRHTIAQVIRWSLPRVYHEPMSPVTTRRTSSTCSSRGKTPWPSLLRSMWRARTRPHGRALRRCQWPKTTGHTRCTQSWGTHTTMARRCRHQVGTRHKRPQGWRMRQHASTVGANTLTQTAGTHTIIMRRHRSQVGTRHRGSQRWRRRAFTRGTNWWTQTATTHTLLRRRRLNCDVMSQLTVDSISSDGQATV